MTKVLQEETTVRPYELRAQTAKVLLRRLYSEVDSLVAQEVDLAKMEARERAPIAVTALRGFIFAMACGLLAMISISACVIAALSLFVGLWLVCLIVAVLYAIAGLGVAAWARKKLAQASQPLRSRLDVLLNPAAGKLTTADRESRVVSARKQISQTMAALEQKTDLLRPMRDTAIGLTSLGAAMSAIVRSKNEYDS